VWVKLKTIAKAIEALLKAGDDEHDRARVSSGAQANEHRAEAEEFHAAKADLWAAQHRQERTMKNCSDDSVHGNSAPVQVTKVAPHVQKVEISERTLSIIAFGFSTAAIVSVLWVSSGQSHEIDRSREEQMRETNRLREEVLKFERESRVLQQQVMDQSALLLREGLRQPDDLINGPAGNLNYRRKEK